jgi:hypothetical protein
VSALPFLAADLGDLVVTFGCSEFEEAGLATTRGDGLLLLFALLSLL